MVNIREQYQEKISQCVLNQVFMGVQRMPAYISIRKVDKRQNDQGNAKQYLSTAYI